MTEFEKTKTLRTSFVVEVTDWIILLVVSLESTIVSLFAALLRSTDPDLICSSLN